ncbi:hypothetical protein [Arthrobacter luteolus]|uniref:hypothetical protein n=1 Tax=Arthrobacter luteolus TaxID=98672 RepID=UPI0008363346|nr:hypothetical protein [Arthrobacter luteolus]
MTEHSYTHTESGLIIDRLDECEKVCILAPQHHAHVPHADIPAVAAELLKAAGHDELAALIEAPAAGKKLQERRAALAAEFGGHPKWAHDSSFGRAIDRIIELEDGKATA